MEKSSKKITVFGATGKVGSLFVEKALEKHYDLTLLVRDSSKLSVHVKNSARIVSGSSTDFEAVKKSLVDADIAVSLLGARKGESVMYDSYKNILNVLRESSKDVRGIFISSIGCNKTSTLIKLALICIGGKKAFKDYDKADILVSNEKQVPYLLIRPYSLTDKAGKGIYSATKSQKGTFLKPIAREDVANFFLDGIENKEYDSFPGVLLSGV